VTKLQTTLHRIDHLIAERTVVAMSIDEGKLAPADEEQLAKDLFNGVWRMLESEDRSPSDDALMIHMVHASRYHWAQVGTAVHEVRGEWQCSRVYAVVRRGEPALYHAQRALEVCEANGIGDFDIAFCYEALARAHAVTGEWDEVERWLQAAIAAAESVADAEDRELLNADIATIPRRP
jgi:hypothetical protein